MKYSFTLTPHNKTFYCYKTDVYRKKNKSLYDFGSTIEQQTNILSFFRDFSEDHYKLQLNEIQFEQCTRGQSRGKVHAHGVIEIPEQILFMVKQSIIEKFGHNGSERCVQFIPLHHPEIWGQYIRKDKNLFI